MTVFFVDFRGAYIVFQVTIMNNTNISGSDAESYSLVAESTKQPASNAQAADGNPSQRAAPPRPTPPHKADDNHSVPSNVCIIRHSAANVKIINLLNQQLHILT